ncbi:BCCT family transporter [Abyssicoccus albus]|uniref:BCCT family transporter n=1 Tax=Abyssicoccus albus TaxID=1817405 RepID=UPI00097E2F69|nr:BCCT family transporter [Abyssicoccus albus]AQL55468.1 choline transporter [Abyssicoccus albus]
MKKYQLMDWPTFILALIVLLAVVLPLILFQEASSEIIMDLNGFVTNQLGTAYLAIGLVIFIYCLYLAFGKYGGIKLGHSEDKPEFNTLSWAAMLFCAGIGSSILYWGIIEWAYYYDSPPFHISPRSEEAINYAASYGIFHWGPLAWSIYVLPALPIAYALFIKNENIIRISHACRPLLGKHTDSWIGKIIDVLFIFGLLGGAGTTLGLATPMIAEGVSVLTGVNSEALWLRILILLLSTIIFAFSSYTGIKNGIKKLSDINIWLTFLLLAFVFIVGPTVFIMETTLSSLGLIFRDFFRMATWLEPFGGYNGIEETKFPQSWTVFYWAWWLVYSPFVGLFIARISKGRTIKEVILGTIIYGTLGCTLFFGILGNFGLWLELSGTFSVTEVLKEQSGPAAIMSILSQLPMSNIAIIIFVLTAIIYLSTTFDSGSYILAGATQKKVDGEPYRFNRLFWAFALSFIPLALLIISGNDSLTLLQTASIVSGAPLIVIFIILMISFMKTLSSDRIKLEERSRLFKEKERKTLSIRYAKDDRWWE